MDCKELSLLRLSPRVFRSSSFFSPLIVLLDTYDFPLGIHISLRLAPNPSNYQQRESKVSMIEILPLVVLNAHSANLLHWLHHLWHSFWSAFRPIWIKIWNHFPYGPKISVKLQNNRSSPLRQLWTQASLVEFDLIPSRLWIPWEHIPYLSSRRMIFLFPWMEYSPVVGLDGIFDSVFSKLSSVWDRKKGLLILKLFPGVFYSWLIW